MYCLDTYALIEICRGNPKFSFLMNEDIVIPNTTLAEFYWVLIKNKDNDEAKQWCERLLNFTVDVKKELLLKAQNFRYLHRKRDISFFDSVGYVFSVENNSLFVTGDKEFKEMDNVKFISK